MILHPEPSRETHFEAAATHFEENVFPEGKVPDPQLAPLPPAGHPRSWDTPTGEFALFDFENYFANAKISSETIILHPESLRETHFEATAALF